MKFIDARFLCFQVIYVTVLSLWLGGWLITWDPQVKRVRVWRP